MSEAKIYQLQAKDLDALLTKAARKPELVSAKRASEMLDMSVDTFKRLVDDGKIRPKHIDGTSLIRYAYQDVINLIK